MLNQWPACHIRHACASAALLGYLIIPCTYRVGVNGRLIEWLASAADRPALQAQIAEVLQVTGAFSISGALCYDQGFAILLCKSTAPCRGALHPGGLQALFAACWAYHGAIRYCLRHKDRVAMTGKLASLPICSSAHLQGATCARCLRCCGRTAAGACRGTPCCCCACWLQLRATRAPPPSSTSPAAPAASCARATCACRVRGIWIGVFSVTFRVQGFPPLPWQTCAQATCACQVCDTWTGCHRATFRVQGFGDSTCAAGIMSSGNLNALSAAQCY